VDDFLPLLLDSIELNFRTADDRPDVSVSNARVSREALRLCTVVGEHSHLPLFKPRTARSLDIRAQDLVDRHIASRIFHALHRTSTKPFSTRANSPSG
jgi:hypothetical protein